MPQRPAEFTESTDLLGRPDELAARLSEDGYLFFRGLLAREDVLEVRGDVLQALGALGWLADGTDPGEGLPGEVIHSEAADEAWFGGYQAIQSLESFHRLGHHPTIVALVRSLIGGSDDLVIHPRKIARVSYPKSGMRTPPHQDYPLIQGTPDVLTAWIPFGDCDVAMGPLRVLAGSHREGLREHGPMTGVGGLGVEIDPDDPRWRSTDYLAGDLLLFFSFTVHYAPPNEGDRLRLSADYRYQSAAEDLVDGSLHPHGCPIIPDWPGLTDDWSTLAWIDAPAAPVVDFRVPDASLTAGSSRFV